MYTENSGKEFANGYLFEKFCFGQDSSILLELDPEKPYLDDVCFPEVYNFFTALVSSVRCAFMLGYTEEELRSSGAFFWRVFAEVKAKLPRQDRKKLRAITLLGMSSDRIHGIDLVFFLGNRMVTVDVTTDHFSFGKEEKAQKVASHLVFDSYQIGRRAWMDFSQNIADLLKDGVGRVPYSFWSGIEKIIYKSGPDTS